MRIIAILAIVSLAAALPQNNPCANIIPVGAEGANDSNNIALARACNEAAREVGVKAKRQSIVEQLQATFDRDNPNGTPAAEGDPADLNGDGVINAFEANSQVI